MALVLTPLDDQKLGCYLARVYKATGDGAARVCNTGLNVLVKGVINMGGNAAIAPGWALNSDDGATEDDNPGYLYSYAAIGSGLIQYIMVLY